MHERERAGQRRRNLTKRVLEEAKSPQLALIPRETLTPSLSISSSVKSQEPRLREPRLPYKD